MKDGRFFLNRRIMNVQGGYLHSKVRLVFIEQIHMSTCTLKAHYIAHDFVD